MNIRDLGKRIMLDFFASFPWTGAIAREWDSIENDSRFKQIEGEIAEIWDTVGSDSPLPLGDPALQLLRIVEHNGMVPAVQFRKAESCMLLLKQLSQNSELGQANDPLIKYDESLQLIREKIDGENGQKELGLAVYELEKSGLIYKHVSSNSPLGWHAISPREYFFCKTDHIFQNWNPKTDGESIIRLLLGKNDNAANLEELDNGLGWGPRRLNSAVAFLYMNNLIHHNYELGGIKYVLPWVRLTEEAHLIQE